MKGIAYIVTITLGFAWRGNSQCSEFHYEMEPTAIEVRIGNVPILRHTHDNPLMEVGIGSPTFRSEHGNFHISQSIDMRKGLQYFELLLPSEAPLSSVEKEGKSGRSSNLRLMFFENKMDNRPTATLELTCGDHGNSRLHVRLLDYEKKNLYNRLWLQLPGAKDEFLYGGGEQYSHFNLKGHAFPMWCREQGVGRGSNMVGYLAELLANAGGDYHTTYWPQPTYVSSRLYYLHVDHDNYNVLNFTKEAINEIEFWGNLQNVNIFLETATSWADLLTKLTRFIGRQPVPPKWIYDGAILGLQGGKDEVVEKYQKLKEKGVKVSAIWIQDWSGKIVTSLGKRVFWNWELDEQFYWEKREMKAKLRDFKTEGVRFLSYVNPHVIKDSAMYKFADERGYFIKNSTTGHTLLVDFMEFDCGNVDFTNPEAYKWFKGVLKEMIAVGFSGWMADFGGEYLPVTNDMQFHDKSENSESMHNTYSYLWAKLNREVYEEDGTGDIFIFMRSGYGRSPGETLMAWAGDQNVDYSIADGLPSVIPAALSLGMSGMGLSHSDIGGYVSLLCMVRNTELLIRWGEMSVFTQVLRTHECNRPDNNWQVYTTNKTAKTFAQLTVLYEILRPYHEYVAELNHKNGWPTQRPLFFSYPDDDLSYRSQYEYMYGPDLLIAPVFVEGDRTKDVYLPPDDWIHLWTGEVFSIQGQGKYLKVNAPLGQPPVFYPKGSNWENLFGKLKRSNAGAFVELEGLSWSLLRSHPLIFLYLFLRKIFYYVLLYF